MALGRPPSSPRKACACSVSSRRSAISLADRDLVFQDFSLVLVQGRRLNPFPRARRERAQASLRSLRESRDVTARAAEIPRSEQHELAHKLGASEAMLRRAEARAKESSRVLGNSSSWLTLARSDHDQPLRRRPTRTDRTGACFPASRRGRPSGVRAQTKVSSRRAS